MNTEMNVETEVILLCVPVSSACSQKMGIKYSESIFLLCLKKKKVVIKQNTEVIGEITIIINQRTPATSVNKDRNPCHFYFSYIS